MGNDGARSLFTFVDSNRNSPSTQLVIDPVTFFIGGLGAIGVGSVADEYHYRHSAENQQENTFANSTFRSLANPIRYAVRFCIGGLIYVIVDTIIMTVFRVKAPIAAGAVTAMCAVYDSRARVFWGCAIGMALFCHVAEIVLRNFR